MIYKLQGQIIEKKKDSLIIDTSTGVAYQVFTAYSTIEECTKDHTTLYIYHHIREDTQQLFGFASLEEREGFIKLTSVSGMGPKAAIKVLSACKWKSLQTFICNENLIQLVSLPGIGKKLAERLITELRDKLNSEQLETINTPSSPSNKQDNQEDLLLALKSLGYQPQEIRIALQKASPSLQDNCIEENIKVLLKHLT
ncbi:MAG: Holliday junction branch migration protein RuvA [bacterium]